MYTSLQLTRKYLHYYLHSSNSKGHGMHSPFVFDFILRVLNNKNNYDPPKQIEQIRKKLHHDKRILHIEDLGAGSRMQTSKDRSVKQLAQTALKSKKYAQLLFRLVKHYRPQTIIELGTSLGITTSYLSAANPGARVISIEGSASVADTAQENFQQLGLRNIESIKGNFDDILPALLKNIDQVDVGYVDGNHRYEPTIRYFLQFLQKSHNGTILIFDDIHWSAEMERAWEEIKAHPSVRYTIDLFFLGFAFFREEFKVKQNFIIRY